MILDDIIVKKKIQVEIKKIEKPLDGILKEIKNDKNMRNFKEALIGDDISIIAEIKKASPSKGIMVEDFDHIKIAKLYENVDVDAISVLTEKNYFKGDDAYINDVKEVTSKPILRKDFIFDEYQIYESKLIGADAVLLIVTVLGDDLKKFYDTAKKIGLDAIVEVHDERELEIALNANVDILGINNRDLKDFHVDLRTTERLVRYVPSGVLLVSESGIKTSDDVKFLKSLGVNAVLIGETFMNIIKNGGKIDDFVIQSKGV
ncbi:MULTISPECIES: indole-3-glycerol phosphate synthase TrpC [Thermoanaerobacterium]|uniref:Indole-3-glycerol phosphate synthase n=2 Tax=Thermoanaerobacterium TaxID=28895 RepID=W9EDT7_9THEO|nr:MULTISPECIES: indole-3-glycerol phosphate synthase TrpC [Thermoanaerobacterium]AFK87016.1 Indole-3-glycerol phosphate synthase [Thermoanaerobacterium saccharolyticum JW/SL-YS485]ETO39175.1 Indole-3-glycerol phosphate synthase [Thermoanaerobacterium aotearoense SCUT27]